MRTPLSNLDHAPTQTPRRRRTVDVPPIVVTEVSQAEEWAASFEGPREAFFPVLGPTVKARDNFYLGFGKENGVVSLLDHRADWHREGPLVALQEALRMAWVPPGCKDSLPSWWPPPSGQWGLLWALGAAPHFVVEGQLRHLVDVPYALLHGLYAAIWEIRFAIREGRDPKEFIETVGAWLLGGPTHESLQKITQRQVLSPNEQIDMVCGLFLMASQNGLLDRVYVGFDSVEKATRPHLRELFTVIQGVQRWTAIEGMPLGLLPGWSGDGASLTKAHPRLATMLAGAVP